MSDFFEKYERDSTDGGCRWEDDDDIVYDEPGDEERDPDIYNRFLCEMETMGEEALLVDGYDDCIIGIGSSFERTAFFIYDQAKMIDKMIAQDGMSQEDAVEYFYYNILGAYLGDGMPVFMMTL